MKRFFNFFLSSKATIILVAILAIALGTATFIEDKYDTVTAKNLVYNTKWIELLFLLLVINLIGHIKAYNLFSKKKIGGLIFHLSFIVMIIGAGITRYTGFEGNIHIRKGESSNIVYTAEPYLMVSFSDINNNYNYGYPINIGKVNDNFFKVSIPLAEKETIEIKYKEIISNAVSTIEENVVGGKDMIELSLASKNGLKTVRIEKGEIKNLGEISLAYNNVNKESVNVIEKDGVFKILSTDDIIESTMTETEIDTIKKDSTTDFKQNYVYKTNGLAFLFSKFYKSAQKKLIISTTPNTGDDAVILDLAIKGKKYQAEVMFKSGFASDYEEYNFDGTTIRFGFGNKTIELPFSLYLKDFIFEKYPGSDSPSSYKSEVTLIDNRNNTKEDHSIFMNNVLDYNQYRFFQSSYDTDEQGTILSVNHDYWGTFVTYLGYTLMCIGFIITLFNKNSRFLSLRHYITEVRNKRKSIGLSIALILGLNGLVLSQNNTGNIIDKGHSEKFGCLLTQTYDGRFAPVHTLALDLMHKISKKENFNVQGRGKMDAMQAFIDMLAEPDFWQQQKIIYIPQQAIKDLIGIKTDYAAFIDFFDENGQYKLQNSINESFRKKQNEKNKFDKEVLKVDERLNIFHMIITGSILKIFPEQASKNHKWLSWNESGSLIPLTGSINIINEDLQLKKLNYSSIMQAYVIAVQKGLQISDYTKANKIIEYISDIQKQFSDPTLLPSETKIKAEVFYNNADIFILLKNLYAILSISLLILAFIDNVKSKENKIIVYALNILTFILAIAFLYHTFGMGLRWYITGHAPWSNGYEALVLVAWGALLAGFSFAKNSKLTLAATTLLAFFVLMTASHSSYDPQLTNLQPVLKSFWLIIHVATLTISYGFLGLGFILGLMNMFIYLFKSEKNYIRLDLLIAENTFIIEMNLIIGLVLATIGTFLGAVWANESWGRYWGWDAKETWALIIVLTYTLVLHMRFIPKLKGKYAFNVASVLGFASVIMTFVGVNYYLSKGMHSYGAGDTPIFPLWAWGTIIAILVLIVIVGIKNKKKETT